MTIRQLLVSSVLPLAVVLVVAACGDSDTTNPIDQPDGGDGGGGGDATIPTLLTEETTLDEGDPDCEFGGTRLDVGLDDGDGGSTADDGALQEGEIDDTFFFCADEDGEVLEFDVLTGDNDLEIGDATCPFGGVEVVAGLDNGDGDGTADDGVLQDDEIDVRVPQCFDPEFDFLVDITDLARGDADCPAGGQRLDSGLDDGAGDDTADDGILGPDEVDNTQTICNITIDDVFEPVAGDVGAGEIDLTGGDAMGTGQGGGGGYFEVELFAGPLPASVELWTSGLVDASFEVPSVTPDLGTVPATVTGEQTIALWSGDGDAPTVLHLREPLEEPGYHLYNGAGTRVTGLQIDAGASLTVSGVNTPTDIDIEADVVVAGQLISGEALTPSVAGSLGLWLDRLFVQETGTITTRAVNNSGSLNIVARAVDGPGIINAGTITTAASDNAQSGGNSGFFYMGLASDLYNTGTISARGGDQSEASNPTGGDFIFIETAAGSLYNSGTISSRGGNSPSFGAGGGTIALRLGRMTEDSRQVLFGESPPQGPAGLVNSGTITVRGGTGSSSGGSGGRTGIHTVGADILSSGSLLNWGGAGSSGGNIFITSDVFYDVPTGQLSVPSSVAFSGSIDISGGDGLNSGGRGGALELDINVTRTGFNSEERPPLPDINALRGVTDSLRVQFLGFGAGIDLEAGGSGGTAGTGGQVQLSNSVCREGFPNCALDRIGARWIYSDVAIDARSEDAIVGGFGGSVYFYNTRSRTPVSAVADASLVENHGDIDVSARRGESDGRSGGTIELLAEGGDTINTGNLTATGGSGGDSGGNDAGSGGRIGLSGLTVSNDAVIDASGGASGDAGSGGLIDFFGVGIVNTGDLISQGSSRSEGSGESAAGGSGGFVRLFASDLVQASGTIDVSGGSIDLAGLPFVSGGLGGTVELLARDIVVDGAVTARSGAASTAIDNGSAQSNGGGTVSMDGDSVTITGTVDASSAPLSSFSALEGLTGFGGEVVVTASSGLNTGTIDVSSSSVSVLDASGTVTGAVGGEVDFLGDNDGTIEARGGAVSGGLSRAAGDGGTVFVAGDNTGCIDVSPGDAGGGAVGVDGTVVVGGDDSGSCP